MKKLYMSTLILVLLSGLLITACGTPEQGTSTVTQTATVTATTTATVTPTSPPTAAGPTLLEQVIKGAKQEGKVVVFGGGGASEVAAMHDGILKEFGVDLEISLVPGRQTAVVAQLVLESESGVTPSYDVMSASYNNLLSVMRPEGIVADVDWQTLIDNMGLDTDYYAPLPADYVCAAASLDGLVYNSDVISEEDLPKSYLDCTDPKYKGKFGWIGFPVANTEICYFLDKADDGGVQFIRDIVANGGSFERGEAIASKLSLGELQFAILDSKEYKRIAEDDPDTPLKFTLLKDFLLVSELPSVPIKGAQNPNAAILVCLWICTPEGLEYQLMTSGSSDPRDIYTNEYAIIALAKSKDIPIIYPGRYKDYCNWLMTPASVELTNKIDLAIKGK